MNNTKFKYQFHRVKWYGGVVMNNTKSKYQFHRVKWYEYEMWKPFPEGRPVNQDRVQAMLKWCTEQFGPANPITDAWARWSQSYSTLRFRDEKDYIFFMLKWS